MGRNAEELSSRARTPVHYGSPASIGGIPIRGAWKLIESWYSQDDLRRETRAAAVHRARTPHGTHDDDYLNYATGVEFTSLEPV